MVETRARKEVVVETRARVQRGVTNLLKGHFASL